MNRWLPRAVIAVVFVSFAPAFAGLVGGSMPLMFILHKRNARKKLLLGASRPKINMALGSLESAGAIRRTTDRLFCDPSKLGAIAQKDDPAG